MVEKLAIIKLTKEGKVEYCRISAESSLGDIKNGLGLAGLVSTFFYFKCHFKPENGSVIIDGTNSFWEPDNQQTNFAF